ncbi:HK97 family phage prohead protease [Mycobacterium riyadhense]|uniref:HK97 family phage prohead protease n=1 Tax=Mycobacterium riyadhense TaxID=486698 RepID=UPI001955FEFA|nr:HK97 family phage prohead protease [Mycobacterium riyadhense]
MLSNTTLTGGRAMELTDDLDALPDWVKRLPEWVRDDEIRWLARRPWVAGFVEPRDFSLDPAIQRFERSQREIRRGYRVATDRQPELVAVRGHMETTMLRYSTVMAGPGITRSLSMSTTNPGRIRGIAVPFGKHSTPVAVAGDVLCIEQFDAKSFAPLPPSCPLKVEHGELSPLGRVTDIRRRTEGLAIEARIDTADRQMWASRWVHGRWSSLSVGFAGGAIFDDWSTTTPDGYPLRTVRGAHLIEVSVCRNPAYPSARITEVLAA